MTLRLLVGVLLLGFGHTFPTDQIPLAADSGARNTPADVAPPDKSRRLHGRFLHITDFHPDFFYKPHSSPALGDNCHRGVGPAGFYGAVLADCDSPFTLVDATFQWINDNLKDSIDFVVWTGDSARHDADQRLPRTNEEILASNTIMVDKFVELFGNNGTDPQAGMKIPIVPNIGNNDMMPHNIFGPGPNSWTRHFAKVWDRFIPEEQRHTFVRGAWFYVEVIPNKLAVFSLNTMYWFASNPVVDGCSAKSEPGYQHFEWLRVQLQFMRARGMKAIMSGHVPPARTRDKQNWDESCWQKYALWMQQYRDVVVGSMYGHMNIDHFMFQDFNEIQKKTLEGEGVLSDSSREALDGTVSAQEKTEYLTDLRLDWSEIPTPPIPSNSSAWFDILPPFLHPTLRKVLEALKSRKQKWLKEIGGPWGERYSLTLVSGSIIPNYFPSMRVIEYNITGLDSASVVDQQITPDEADDPASDPAEKGESDTLETQSGGRLCIEKSKKHKKPHKKHHQKPSKFDVPLPPSKSAPPGPAYSPQTFSWLGYTEYFANLTRIQRHPDKHAAQADRAVVGPDGESSAEDAVGSLHRHGADNFTFEVEYNTLNDHHWHLRDLTVRSYLDLAWRIGRYQPSPPLPNDVEAEPVVGDNEEEEEEEEEVTAVDGESDLGPETEEDGDDDVEADKHKHKRKHKNKHKKHKKKHHRHHRGRRDANKVWFAFVRRAFISSIPDDQLKDDFEIA